MECLTQGNRWFYKEITKARVLGVGMHSIRKIMFRF